jgi:UDPglucose--hexose-1-phosphate uridylyltransferase
LLSDYLEMELKQRDRVVCENAHFVVLVPFWAVWPFETLLLPRRGIAAPNELLPEEISALADIVRRTLSAYDGLFDVPAPYSMGFHPRPSDGSEYPEWLFHAHFYPPLLRSATIRKHLVGFEMLGMPQRDLTPESAAARLRACTTQSAPAGQDSAR